MSRPQKSTRSTVFLVGVLFVGLALSTGLDWPARSSEAAPLLQVAAPELPQVRRAAELSDAFTAIAEAVTPAVVRIEAEHFARTNPHARLRDLFGLPESHPEPPPGTPQLAGGTGFIISNNGYILTNNHVIDGADRIRVTLLDRRTFEAKLVGRDLTTDVAVIKVEAQGLPAVRMGDSEQARVGEWVLAIGNPGFGDQNTLDFTVTSGIISAKGRPLRIINRELYYDENEERRESAPYAIEDFIQTDAVINPGNSGGPLVDLQGEVIGINTAIASSSGSYEGYGFAIPMNLVQRVAKDLVEHGYVRRALLGINIRELTPEDAEVYRLPSIAGVLVEDFGADSPAREAGLERQDVIVEVAGHPVRRVGQLQRLVAQHAPGDVVDVAVIRFGEEHRFKIRLTEAEALAARPERPASPPHAPPRVENLGLQLIDLDAVIARELGLDATRGVLVHAVDAAGAAAGRIVRLDQILMINQREVGSAREARTLLRRLETGDIASFVLRGEDGTTRVANVRVP